MRLDLSRRAPVTPAPVAVDEPGFRLAIACTALLAGISPACIGLALFALSPWNIDAFVGGLFASLIVGPVTTMPIAVGMRRQPRWWRRWTKGAFRFAIVAWASALAAVLLYPLGLVPLHPSAHGSLAPAAWTGLVFAVAVAPAAWWIARVLRKPRRWGEAG